MSEEIREDLTTLGLKGVLKEKLPITYYTNIIDALTNSLWTSIEFAAMIAEKRNAQENIPPYTFRNQLVKMLEEIREYAFAVESKQGEPAEHTREHQVEEGLDVHFALLSSYDSINITKDEVRKAVTDCIVKFQAKGWLD